MAEALLALLNALSLSSAGLMFLCGAAFIAGVVRGFTGFGTALVFIPAVGQVLDPVSSVVTLIFLEVLGPVLLVPRMLPLVNRADLMRLILGAAVMLPLGSLLLVAMSGEVFRWAVCLLALGTLAILASGVRYSKPPSPPMVLMAGGLSGFSAGVSGMAGPPVVLLYLASRLKPDVVRATILIFLLCSDVLLLSALGLQGAWSLGPVILGLCLSVPAALGLLLGNRVFDPARGTVYRAAAYATIGGSALLGLPLFA